jgi:pyruvate-formate lyase-activating enzyme
LRARGGGDDGVVVDDGRGVGRGLVEAGDGLSPGVEDGPFPAGEGPSQEVEEEPFLAEERPFQEVGEEVYHRVAVVAYLRGVVVSLGEATCHHQVVMASRVRHGLQMVKEVEGR